MPDVSFIVAAHNVAPYIEAAVASALAQTGVTVEVIVVDDASSDETASKAEEISKKDPRVRLIRQPTRGGPSAARNAAMDAASGDWLAILDADDIVAHDRTRRLIGLAVTTSSEIVADNFERFSEARGRLSTMIDAPPEPYAFFVGVATFLEGNAMFGRNAHLGYIKPMLRREFLSSHSIRYQEQIVIGEDFHHLLTCLMAGARFVVTSESFYKYRVREGSISYRLSASDVDTLLEAYAETNIDAQYKDDPEIQDAARTYVGALKRAKVVAKVVDDAKAGNWSTALTSAVSHPNSWPLLTRFGGAAAAKRLRRS